MKGFEKLLLSVTLVGGLAATSTAAADTALIASAAAPSLATSGATLAAHLPRLQPLPPQPSESPSPAADVQRLLAEPLPAPACRRACDENGKSVDIARELLHRLGTLPVLGAVMAPVTRGVLIPTGEGTPPLELTVIPTQIKRGSGLVATGRF
jgi:hypothetical protein